MRLNKKPITRDFQAKSKENESDACPMKLKKKYGERLCYYMLSGPRRYEHDKKRASKKKKNDEMLNDGRDRHKSDVCT